MNIERLAMARRLWLFLCGLFLLCFTLPATADQTEQRIALVIGIGAYRNAPVLTSPSNDARAVSDSLRRLNFDVMEAYNSDFRAFDSAISAFGVRAASADVAVVFYAGHGLQVDRENYLIPTDARLERDRDLPYQAIPVGRLLGEASQAGRIGIVLLDNCRNNPFVERIASTAVIAGRAVVAKPGMARVGDIPGNTVVVMCTRPDQFAEDGRDHSAFAAAILAHLQIPGLELGLFFRGVRDSVLKATAGGQEPYVFSSLGAEPFYFYPGQPNRPPVIGEIPTLRVLDSAGPTPLGIPRPTDPDQDPLTVHIIALPPGGEVRVEGRLAAPGEVFAVDRFMTATFKPDAKVFGAIGAVDILVEDGRGGSVTGSLPIVVARSPRPPLAETLPAAARPAAPRTTAASHAPGPCPDIVERVQLGESLSDAERTLLHTTCGR